MIAKINVLLLGLFTGQACSTYESSYDPSSSETVHSAGAASNDDDPSSEQASNEEGGFALHWHFPCEEDSLEQVDSYGFYAAGHNWLNIQTLESFQLKVSGRACDSIAARNTVFVLDTSGSMGDKDRPQQGDNSCSRYRVLEELAAKLYRSEALNLGVIRFSGSASCLKLTATGITFGDCQSAGLIAAHEFKRIVDEHSDQLKSVACSFNGGTSYTSALTAAEHLFAAGGGGNNELYFFSDGEPGDGPAAKTAATRMKNKHAFIATIGFGDRAGNFLKGNISSVVKGEAAHRQANNISDLATHFNNLLDTNHATGKLKWERYGLQPDSGTVTLDALIQNDGSYSVPALTFDVSEPLDNKEQEGVRLEISIQPGFSKSSEYTIKADLRFE